MQLKFEQKHKKKTYIIQTASCAESVYCWVGTMGVCGMITTKHRWNMVVMVAFWVVFKLMVAVRRSAASW